jgi:hypothetical protein
MLRRPATIWLIRLAGTSVRRASPAGTEPDRVKLAGENLARMDGGACHHAFSVALEPIAPQRA